jgi:DNA-binding transcriptional MerR regulator
MRYLRTSDLARAVGVHPNTVRRYVDRGLLPPITRSPAGYRCFTPRHLECLRLACQVYRAPFPGMALHQSGKRIVEAAVGGDLKGARELASQLLNLVRAEQAQAELAADLLERWAFGPPAEEGGPPLRIGQAARVLGVSIDIVRSWDRNGLIDIPRDPANGYRRYGAAEMSRLRVIRMLSRAGYSTAAILRMLLQLDRGATTDLRHALDTPRPDEDAHLASDRWLSTLADQEQRAHTILTLLDEQRQRR